ncbi:hypothetical protein Hanom_Chr14g01323741 [Helianthus anomalus]
MVSIAIRYKHKGRKMPTNKVILNKKSPSKLQVLFFMFTTFCRRCPLAEKLTSFVLNVSKSCTFYPLGQTQLDFLVKYGHVSCT